jgi:phospholipid-translocating ATPase
MSLSAEYLHGIDHSDLPSGAESDEDLDLEELDPETVDTRGNSRNSRDENRRLRGYGARIALRNLRTGGRNRLWGRETPGRGRESEDDLSGLLEEPEDGGRYSQGSSNHNEDDAPLLSGRRRSRVRYPTEDDRRPTKLRLPSFRSNALQDSHLDTIGPVDNGSENKPAREVLVGQPQRSKYPANVVSNAKYTPWSFLPRTLYNEFSFFFNLYFLLVALSQIIPVLRIGYMSSYIAPLAFVVSISLGKEAYDDIGRRRRDAEANSEEFTVLSFGKPSPGNAPGYPRGVSRSELGTDDVFEITKKSRDLKVGDVLKVRKDQRLPADVIILKSTLIESTVSKRRLSEVDEQAQENDLLEPIVETTSVQESVPTVANVPPADDGAEAANTGDTFIRTDQLDGETDWKLRLPSTLSQTLSLRDFTRLRIHAGPPDRRVNDFVGTIELTPPSFSSYDPPINKPQGPVSPHDDSADQGQGSESPQVMSAPLSIDNTAWANTVLASNTTTLAVIIYTGSQTRSALSTSPSRSKVGLLEYEINNLTKILCVLTLTLSIILVALEGFQPTNDKEWYIAIMIYLILFSTIIPMSLRVNLDMAKTVYARFIERDQDIPGTVVRTSTIPEDLGRIEYLLSDKTGTLTQNGKWKPRGFISPIRSNSQQKWN